MDKHRLNSEHRQHREAAARRGAVARCAGAQRGPAGQARTGPGAGGGGRGNPGHARVRSFLVVSAQDDDTLNTNFDQPLDGKLPENVSRMFCSSKTASNELVGTEIWCNLIDYEPSRAK